MGFSGNDKVRIKNSVRNMATSAMLQTILGIVSFIERTVFIKCLSTDYLGLNSLFSSVLYVLSIAELGIGSTIAFALYKPLAEKNELQVAMYMRFFRRAYQIIGGFILAAGLLFSPFIDRFAKDGKDISGMNFYFVLYLFAVGSTYFFSYKQILIEADQKKFINQAVICIGSILQLVIQMCVLVFTRNYTLYISVFLIVNIGKNILLSITADKLYPLLKLKKQHVPRLEGTEKARIVSNIKAMCFHKFGEVAIGSSDSILISMLVDLKALGLYANYQIILEALRSAMRIFYLSMLASIGNMCATEDDDKIYESFKSLNFSNYILFSYITVLVFNLIQPVIGLWLGRGFLLDDSTVFFISFSFFLTGIRRMVLNFHDAFGLFWADKYKRVLEAVVNIIVSYFLGRRYGLDGIFIGTCCSNLVGFGIEGYVVYKYAFHKPVYLYISMYLRQSVLTAAIMLTTHYACSLVSAGLLVDLLSSILMCLVIPLFFYWLFYRKNTDFIRVRKNLVEVIRLYINKI